MTITKARIIDAVFEPAGLPRKVARLAVDRLIKIIKKTLAGEEDVLVSGFGKFQVMRKRVRRGRNPQTGEDLQLRPRRVVVFRTSGILRQKINGEEAEPAVTENFETADKN